MKYQNIDDIIAGKLIEKCVNKYLVGYSQYVHDEAIQHCYLTVLEAIARTPDIKCLECFTINIVRNQICSKHSTFYYDIWRYEKNRRTQNEIGDNPDDLL